MRRRCRVTLRLSGFLEDLDAAQTIARLPSLMVSTEICGPSTRSSSLPLWSKSVLYAPSLRCRNTATVRVAAAQIISATVVVFPTKNRGAYVVLYVMSGIQALNAYLQISVLAQSAQVFGLEVDR